MSTHGELTEQELANDPALREAYDGMVKGTKAEPKKWDVKRREAFRKAYDQALGQDIEVFEFDGDPYYIRYAKYLLEYLDMQLPKKEDWR